MATTDPLALVEKMRLHRDKLYSEIGKVIIGQEQVIENLVVALFSRGHVLLIGVPGLAKTLLVSTFAKAVDLTFNRIQFTPDLMPADITGTQIIQDDPVSKTRSFKFIKGPIFANAILADEINRTPPKTQAALLQAMQENEVTSGGETHQLDLPFWVLATQNPIEQEGTYPLPEAQLDRFMFSVVVDYPNHADEVRMVQQTTSQQKPEVENVLSTEDILQVQDLVRGVVAEQSIVEKAVSLVRASRPDADSPDFVRHYLRWGAGPRASQYILLGAKSRAILQGRTHVDIEDIRTVAAPVLRHRLVTNFHAESEGVSADEIVQRLLEAVK